MKKEDLFLLLVLFFSSTIVGCLAVNGEVPEEPLKTPVEFIDSKMSYDTIKDVRFLTKNHNNNEETCICNYARDGTHIMWGKF